MNTPATTASNPPPSRSGKTATTSSDSSSPYPINIDNLSPSTKALDLIAHYLGERGMAGDPIATAFAAVFAIEGAGLKIVDPNADRKEEG